MPETGPVTCICGEPLVDDVTRAGIAIDGEEIRFRRGSDFVVCSACGRLHGMNDVARLAEGQTDDQALDELHELSGGAPANAELEEELGISGVEPDDLTLDHFRLK